VGEKVLHLHYFAAACDWWIAAYDPATGTAFGYASLGDPQNAEWGYVHLPELQQVKVGHGLLIVERDLDWPPSWPPTLRFPAATTAEKPRRRRTPGSASAGPPENTAALRSQEDHHVRPAHPATDQQSQPSRSAELAMLDPATLLTD
jgi:hypothetical protein